MRFNTLAAHAGLDPHQPTTPASPPLERAASWSFATMAALDDAFEGAGPGYYYGRDGMPTPALLEEALTALEGGNQTLVYATGMAAIAGGLQVAGAGKRVLAAPDLYGKTYFLLNSWLAAAGAEVRFVSAQDHSAVEAALAGWQPHLLVVETMSNPLVKVSDVPWLVGRAHEVGCKVLVDNTFASPYLFRPAQTGADYTVESLTKYINGHGDVLGGSVTTLNPDDYRELRSQRTAFGTTLDPQAAWLTLRGMRTLGLRLQRQCENASHLAAWLADHPAVARVYYPGLDADPGHALAKRLWGDRGYGGMLAFDLAPASRAHAWAVMDRLQLALRAPTLGDITTLVSYPAHASHRALSPEQRAAVGIGDGLIRVSTGIEDIEDIIADFEQALAGPPR